MSILKVLWLIMAVILAGALITGVIIAFGMMASVIGVLLAGLFVVVLIRQAWREFRSSRKAKQ